MLLDATVNLNGEQSLVLELIDLTCWARSAPSFSKDQTPALERLSQIISEDLKFQESQDRDEHDHITIRQFSDEVKDMIKRIERRLRQEGVTDIVRITQGDS